VATHLTLDDRIDQAAASVVACAAPSDERLRNASARKVDPAEQGRLARIAWARYRKPFPLSSVMKAPKGSGMCW